MGKSTVKRGTSKSSPVKFKYATWNFTEAVPGKGAPDGIGATLKRTADQIVAHGIDITSALALHEQLKKTEASIKLFSLPSVEIEEAIEDEKAILKALPVVPGTMKLHQVVTSAHGHLS